MTHARINPSDRRAEQRIELRSPARLFYGPRLEMWADCVIRDRSGSGAKVEVGQLFKLPARVVLAEIRTGVAFDAIVKWRRGDMAGLQFEARHDLQQDVEARLAQVKSTWLALSGGVSAT